MAQSEVVLARTWSKAQVKMSSRASLPNRMALESAIAEGKWSKARGLIKRFLKSEPKNHWLLTRLGLTYYEQFDYPQALSLEKEALSLKPDCPLVQWDYAGTLQMLDRPREAIKMYDRILRRDVESLAYDECGEGRARARGLRADSLYRAAQCYELLGDRKKAAALIDLALAERGPGCQSIHPISQLRKFAARLIAAS